LTEYPKFRSQVRQAVEYYQTVLLDKVEKAADGDWHASVWLLRNHPDRNPVFCEGSPQTETPRSPPIAKPRRTVRQIDAARAKAGGAA